MKLSQLYLSTFHTTLLLAYSEAASMGPNPKMVSEEVSPKGSPNLFDAAAPNKVLSSNNAIYLGDCSPTKPFVFRIGSRAGRLPSPSDRMTVMSPSMAISKRTSLQSTAEASFRKRHFVESRWLLPIAGDRAAQR